MILKIYDYFERHPWIRRTCLLLLTSVMVLLATTLSYKEDISEFLPLQQEDKQNMEVFQNISGASEFVVLFDNHGDEEQVIAAIETFREELHKADTHKWTTNAIWRVDAEQVSAVTSFVYDNIPYALTSADYARMDSLLSADGYVQEALERDVEMLMFPTGGFLQDNISKDPLGLFTPVIARLQKFQRESNFEQVDGYIFSPDKSKAIVLIQSPFGNRETNMNNRLLDMLNEALQKANAKYPEVTSHITGGPVIAVENARQIKSDSILTISIASILILLLLFYAFRSATNILLTAGTILWGCLFALAGISLVHSDVSLIVLGISSIIIGIAFNYPLHLINHLSHQPDVRLALKEIVSPLMIGNITTIGAFLALVPLDSVALRDLGIFASLMLLGTILFVLLFLPHYIKREPSAKRAVLLDKLASVQLDKNKYVVATICILTLIFAYASFQTQFDADVSHINYMTSQQRDDLQQFASMSGSDASDSLLSVYAVSTGTTLDEALALSETKRGRIDTLLLQGKIVSTRSVSDFVTSSAVQKQRIAKWNDFVHRHRATLCAQLEAEATRVGFSPDAFSDFQRILAQTYAPKLPQTFSPLTSSVLKEHFTQADGKAVVIEHLLVPAAHLAEVEASVPASFDIKSLNSKLSSSITDDFNYIGCVCSLIVFLFLWYSFRNLRLAILAFIPMAISWVWILGIMSLVGIKFNIVNIILATFIFGQGDDYTIFMTEGCVYEHKEGKPMLISYKTSIILSALIMFAGIGVLVLASHPAMYSLGIVTVVGMFCVVLMAFVLPPFIYRLLFVRNATK